MSPTLVEHLVFAVTGDHVVFGRDLVALEPGVNPILHAERAFPGSLVHSTSWRWENDAVILTFAHVLPDDSLVADDLFVERLSAHDIETQPVACHAIRHLHFLERTDPAIARIAAIDAFWNFAAHVARHHHPAVAGLLPQLHAVSA